MPIFNDSMETKENEVPVLVLENKKMFQKTVEGFLQAMDGAECENLFFIADDGLNMKKHLDVVTDLFHTEINQSKNLTKLYNYLKTEFAQDEKYMDTVAITQSILKYVADLAFLSDFELTYHEELDISAIFKAVDLKFYCEDTSLLEKLIDYVKVMSGFIGKKLFVLLNFKTTFDVEEQKEFYKFIAYSKINVFILESVEPKDRLENEVYRIIDADLCIIN